jgi:hypothetical protein
MGIDLCKNKQKWQNIEIYVIKCKEKWGKIVRKHETEAELNVNDFKLLGKQ